MAPATALEWTAGAVLAGAAPALKLVVALLANSDRLQKLHDAALPNNGMERF